MTTQEANWQPKYEPWRHGGWYVTNVWYPSGAVGCVSNNYPDKKWRITQGGDHSGTTFPTRDAAARAERVLTFALCEIAAQAEIAKTNMRLNHGEKQMVHGP